ncbi:MAG: glycosyltransferase involved in cell wall biosynthesis [Granulosicoccus sp.]|jgi:glycosyltransferase involved in cell wall biosynthesis
MKILMLIDSLVKGGRERRLIKLLKFFSASPDIEVGLVIFSKKVEYEEIYDLDVKLHFLERKPAKDPRVFSRFYKICKSERPDIIHSWGTMPSVYAIPAVKLLGIKFLNANIADAPLKMSIWDERYFRAHLTFPFSDMIVGNSNAGLKSYGAPLRKSQSVYNGFDFKRVANLEDKDKVRRQFNILPGKVVGMVGGFFDRKDFDTFVEAACLYLRESQDTTFMAIGDGPNLARCEAKVPDEFKDRILFPSMVHGVESLANVFDIGVLCTNTKVHGEGIFNSILEYMVLEKPVVATKGGGTDEIVVNSETGYLIEPFDPKLLVSKITRLLDDPAMAEEFGRNGKKRVYAKFSLPRMEQDYLKIYRKLLPLNKTVIA